MMIIVTIIITITTATRTLIIITIIIIITIYYYYYTKFLLISKLIVKYSNKNNKVNVNVICETMKIETLKKCRNVIVSQRRPVCHQNNLERILP